MFYDFDVAIAIRLAYADRRQAGRRGPGQPWGDKPTGLDYEDPQAVLAAELAARKAA